MRLSAALLLALALAGPAAAATHHYAPLPSPVAPLSAVPPLGGGAIASTENTRHRVSARTAVRVMVDAAGAPFAVSATQRLDVRVLGDYFFTIGAPVLDVEAAPGSESTPGLRSTSILWAGFNPGKRRLAARLTLDPEAAGPALPLRIEVHGGTTTLVNATATSAGAFTADATVPPLAAFLTRLQSDLAAGRPPSAGAADLTSTPRPTRVRVVAPLLVRGRIGSQAVSQVVTGRLVVPAAGRLRLTVVPVTRIDFGALPHPTGRALLDRATRASLQLARLRQYETFLGNPDPTGSSHTTYAYASGTRPSPPAAARAAQPTGRDWTRTAVVVASLLAAGAAALAVWARS